MAEVTPIARAVDALAEQIDQDRARAAVLREEASALEARADRATALLKDALALEGLAPEEESE